MEARPSWVPEHLFPFASRRADVAGCRVHYIDEGAGRPLLFLHGNPTWSFLYRDIVRTLQDGFRCIAVDYPGFGLSRGGEGYGFTPAEHAEVIDGLVRQLDLSDVTLVGQDWGGPIGLTVATRRRERFAGLVLGNTWAWPLNREPQIQAFSRFMGGPLGKVLIREGNAFVNFMIPVGTYRKLSREVMDAYRGPFARKDQRMPTYVFPRALLKSRAFLEKLEEDLPAVTDLPTLLLWGGRDPALRAKVEMKRLEKIFPNHHSVVINEARHYFQEDAPKKAAAEIRRWMETLPPDRG